MAIKAKSPLAPYWYTPKDEKGSANPTRFKLRPLDGLESQDIELHKDDRGGFHTNATSARAVLGHAVQDWENMLDPATGEPLKFNVQDKAESLRLLPNEIVSELFWEVFFKSSLSEEQEKN